MPVALQELSIAIKRLQHRHHRTLDTELAPLGITLVQWHTLRHIGENPGASAHTLAQLTFQSDQSFGTLANRLVERALIAREQGAGRAIAHRLTPAGKKLWRSGNAVVDAVLAASLGVLNATEREVLHGLLQRLLRV